MTPFSALASLWLASASPHVEASVVLPDGRTVEALLSREDLDSGAPAVRFVPRLANGRGWDFGDSFARALHYGCTVDRPDVHDGQLTCAHGVPTVRPDVTLPDTPAAFVDANVPVVEPGGRPVTESPRFLLPWLAPVSGGMLLLWTLAVLAWRSARASPPLSVRAPVPVLIPVPTRIGLALITVVAALLRGLALDAEPYEQNEFTYAMSGFGHATLDGVLLDVNALAQTHPPLYHVLLFLLKPWLGTAPWVGRLPAMLAGAALIPLVGLLAHRLRLAPAATLLVAGLAAIAPVHQWYSQDCTPYTLNALFAVTALLSAVSALDDPTRRRPWIGLLFSAMGLLMTHYYGVHLIITTLLVLSVSGTPALRRRALATGLAIGSGVLLWLPAFVQGYLWSRGHSTAYQRAAGVYHADASLPADLLEALRLAAGAPTSLAWLAPIGLLVGLWAFPRRTLDAPRRALLVLPVLWFLSFELVNRGTFLKGLYGGYYFGIRYGLFLFPVVWLWCGAAFDEAWRHGSRVRRAVTTLAATLGLIGGAWVSLQQLLSRDKPEVAMATALVSAHLRDGDALAVGPAGYYVHPVAYYLAQAPDRDTLTINDLLATPTTREPGWLGVLSDLFEPWDRALQSAFVRRLWLIDHTQHLFGRREFSDRPSVALLAAVARAGFDERWRRDGHDVQVRLFERRPDWRPTAPPRVHFGWDDAAFVRRVAPPPLTISSGRRVRPGAEVIVVAPEGHAIAGLRLRAGTMPPGGHRAIDAAAPTDAVLHLKPEGSAPLRTTLSERFHVVELAVTLPGATSMLRVGFGLEPPGPGDPQPPEVILDWIEPVTRPLAAP